MAEVIIDTNVLMVASRRHDDVSPACVLACVERLQKAQKVDVIVIDDGYRILREYQANLDTMRGKGVGEAFLKWLLQNQANSLRVYKVQLTEHAADEFAEFPCAALAAQFDPSDRKFAAVANAHPAKPAILQAVDSRWLQWSRDLKAVGIRVEFLCPKDIEQFFQRKFPGEPVPALA